MKKFLAYIPLFLLISGVLIAEESSDWKFNGQIQYRTEADGTDFNNKTYMPISTSMRTRLNISKMYKGALFMGQLSDSRIMGDGGGTLAESGNLDIHQAYVKLSSLFGTAFDLQVGRFEMNYGTERFIGPVGWHYIGRTFDGARLTLNINKDATIDLFSTVERESASYKGNPNSSFVPSEVPTNKTLHGLWGQFKLSDAHKLDLFAYLEGNRTTLIDDFSRTTLGGSYWGTFDKIKIIAEAAYQLGSSTKLNEETNVSVDQDIAAYTASLIAKYMYKDGSVGIAADIMSGTDPNDLTNTDNNAYATSFGTNHKFYGYMDYFISVDKNTSNKGLNDFYLMWKHNLSKKFLVGLNAHYFMTNVAYEVNEFDSDGNKVLNQDGTESMITEASTLGQEFDLTLKYKFNPSTTLTWGNSLFIAGDVMINKYNGRQDAAFWSYLMITANF